MRKTTLLLAFPIMLVACSESLEDRAEREVKEYTEKFCPTPVNNNTRTDSVTFDKATKTYTYHCSFLNQLDDSVVINQVRTKLHDQLLESLAGSTNAKPYKEAGFSFEYICHSAKNPRLVLYQDIFTSKQLNQKVGK